MSDFAVNENFADPTNGVPVDAIPPQQDNVEWVLIAEAEWKLNSHEKKQINLALNRHLPNKPVENIRKIRNKPQYRTFYNDFIFKRTAESSKPTTTLLNHTPNLHEVENVESDTHLKQFVIGNYQLINLPTEELSQPLCHLTGMETRQNLIDKEDLMTLKKKEKCSAHPEVIKAKRKS